MAKRWMIILCLICAVVFLQAQGISEQKDSTSDDAHWQFCCFADARWVRSTPSLMGKAMRQLPPWTVIRYQAVNEDFGIIQIDDTIGYIHLGMHIPLEMVDILAEPLSPSEGITAFETNLYPAPVSQAPAQRNIPAGVRIQVYPISKDYFQVTADGKAYFLKAADFTEKTIQRTAYATPSDLYAPEGIPLRYRPYYGSPTTELPGMTPVHAIGTEGEDLVVTWDGQEWYIAPAALQPVPAPADIDPLAGEVDRTVDLLQFPLENSPIAGTLPANTPVQVIAFSGDYFLGKTDGATGYIPMDTVKNTEDVLAFLQVREQEVMAHRFLDIALSMLEEDNPILVKYKETAPLLPEDRLVRPQKYKLGIPYLFGGTNIKLVGQVMQGLANSLYYSKEKRYIGGLDCMGFARTVHRQWGMPRLPKISSIPDYQDRLIDLSDTPMDQWHHHLQPGDCIAIGYGRSNHITLYMGTLRTMGFTPQDVGDPLHSLLDNPLVIHVGMNNFATQRFTDYIRSKRLRKVTPPDGGITISLIAPNELATDSETMWTGTPNEKTFYWCDLQGYPLNFMDLTSDRIAWWKIYRNDKNNPPAQKPSPATRTNLSEVSPVPTLAPATP